jgi:hypothetical protein
MSMVTVSRSTVTSMRRLTVASEGFSYWQLSLPERRGVRCSCIDPSLAGVRQPALVPLELQEGFNVLYLRVNFPEDL